MRLDKKFVNWREIQTRGGQCVPPKYYSLSVTVCVAPATGWGNPSHLPPQHLCLLWGLGPRDPAAILHSLRRWSEVPASKYVLSVHFYHRVIPLRLSLWGTGQMTSLIYNPFPDSGKIQTFRSCFFHCSVEPWSKNRLWHFSAPVLRFVKSTFGIKQSMKGVVNLEFNWTCLILGQQGRV